MKKKSPPSKPLKGRSKASLYKDPTKAKKAGSVKRKRPAFSKKRDKESFMENLLSARPRSKKSGQDSAHLGQAGKKGGHCGHGK